LVWILSTPNSEIEVILKLNIKHNFDNLQVGVLVQHLFYKDAVVAYF
jgi:hypothetical protein